MAVPPTDADARAVAKTMESMVDSKKLLELAKRVEREEPTWMLTLEIECALHPGAKIVRFASDETNAIKLGANHYRPMNYLTSIDAAVTLVPEGASIEIDGPRRHLKIPWPAPNWWRAIVTAWAPMSDSIGWGETMATALCAAALRARAALLEGTTHD